jgi:hypothetical protein
MDQDVEEALERRIQERDDSDLAQPPNLEQDLEKAIEIDKEKQRNGNKIGALDIKDTLADNTSDGSSANTAVQDDQIDPNIVFWDGPNDPENPRNWSARSRWGIIALISLLTFITYIS